MTLSAQIIEIIPSLLASGAICVFAIICCRSIMNDCRVKVRAKRRK